MCEKYLLKKKKIETLNFHSLLNDFRLCCRTGKDEHVSVQRPDWSRLHETDHVLDSEQVNFFNLNIDIIVFYNQSPVKWKKYIL